MQTLQSGIVVPDNYDDYGAALVAADEVHKLVADQSELLKSLSTKQAPFRRRLLPGLALLGVYDGINDPDEAHRRTMEMLRRVAATWLIRSIIETRIRQVQRYARVPRFRGDVGIEVIMNDPDERPSSGDKRRMAALRKFLLAGGVPDKRELDGALGVFSYDGWDEAPDLMAAWGMIARDSLTLDQVGIWMNPTFDPRWPVTFMKPVDAALLRRTFPKIPDNAELAEGGNYNYYKPEVRPGLKNAEWVMLSPVNPRAILAEYTRDDLIWMVRNPRTEWWAEGYGYSEIESLIELVVGMMCAVSYNVSWFTDNHVPPTILFGSGGMSRKWLEDFLKIVQSQVGGPGKWHKLPTLFGEAGATLQAIPLNDFKQQDMYWEKWMQFLTAAICSVMQMAPEEVGFASFRVSNGGMGDKNDTVDRVLEAKETGLRAFLYRLEATYAAVVERFWADSAGWGPYTLRIKGIDEFDEEREGRIWRERIETGRATLNEARAEEDKPLYYDPKDADLWEKCETDLTEAAEKRGAVADEDPVVFNQAVADLYRKRGGKLMRYTDLPISPQALQARSQELQSDMQAQGMGPDGQPMGGAPGGPGGPDDGGQQQFMGPDGQPLPPDEIPQRQGMEGDEDEFQQGGQVYGWQHPDEDQQDDEEDEDQQPQQPARRGFGKALGDFFRPVTALVQKVRRGVVKVTIRHG